MLRVRDMNARPRYTALTFSTTFPNPTEPVLGLFVRARVLAVSRKIGVNVVAPLSLFQGLTLSRAAFATPAIRQDECFDVFHPRWLNIPGGSPINAVLLAISTVMLLLRLRKRMPVDIIDAHFGYIDGVAACLIASLLRKPFMVTLRGSEILHAQYRWRRWAMGWALRRATRVIAVSSNLRQLALDLGVRDEVLVEISNGVNTDVFSPRRARVPPAVFGVRYGSKIIASLGNLISLKGHHRVIAAIPSLIAKGLDVELLIAGAGSSSESGYEGWLRSLAKEWNVQDRVHFLGKLSQGRVADVMCIADILCLASEREGCPNVVREALACGTPVVATRVGATPQLIPDERFGFVVPVNDDIALQEALASAVSRNWDYDVIALWGAARNWEQVADEVLREMDLAVVGA
jgi:teichuronic acid biosynthesis glycosyltransferase TuaC